MTDPTTAPQHTKLSFSPDTYRDYVRDMGLSTSQEDALLQAVWSVVVGIIDLKCGPQVFENPVSERKALAVDSAAVLAFFSTPEATSTEDATPDERTDARRMDS